MAGVSPISQQRRRTLTIRQGLMVLQPANRSGVTVHNKPRGPSANVSLPPRSLTLKETTAAWFSDMPDGLFEKLDQMRHTKGEAA